MAGALESVLLVIIDHFSIFRIGDPLVLITSSISFFKTQVRSA